MDGWQVMEQAAALAERGEAVALATVVWRQRPSSGQVGSRAIITASGEVHGWIGGACAEPSVINQAREVIAEGSPRLLLLGSTDKFGDAIPEGMTAVPISCQSEGALEVYIEPVQASTSSGRRGPIPDGARACRSRQGDWLADRSARLDRVRRGQRR